MSVTSGFFNRDLPDNQTGRVPPKQRNSVFGTTGGNRNQSKSKHQRNSLFEPPGGLPDPEAARNRRAPAIFNKTEGDQDHDPGRRMVRG